MALRRRNASTGYQPPSRLNILLFSPLLSPLLSPFPRRHSCPSCLLLWFFPTILIPPPAPSAINFLSNRKYGPSSFSPSNSVGVYVLVCSCGGQVKDNSFSTAKIPPREENPEKGKQKSDDQQNNTKQKENVHFYLFFSTRCSCMHPTGNSPEPANAQKPNTSHFYSIDFLYLFVINLFQRSILQRHYFYIQLDYFPRPIIRSIIQAGLCCTISDLSSDLGLKCLF